MSDSAAPPRSANWWRELDMRAAAPFAALAVLMVLGYLVNPVFLTFDNLANVLARCSFVAIIAVGATFVITAGGLDLSSANVAARLVDQPASHQDVGPNDVCPTGDKLIDTSNRSASWLLKKLSKSTVGTCGSTMPYAGNLSSIQLSCLQNWINNVPPGGT